MPINEKKMMSLQKFYGRNKGRDVYFALENKEKQKKKDKKNAGGK